MRGFLFFCLVLFLSSCATSVPPIPIDSRSVEPGTQVMRGNDSMQLLGTPLKVGDPLPTVQLFSKTLKRIDPSQLRGEVLLISVVPSLDTQVCERQTHMLAAQGATLPEGVRRITISRDLPFAQKRFSEEEAVLSEVLYLSDYAQAEFGQATGLLVDQIYLLARALIVVDRQGIVRYLQVVPSITHLPDMEKAAAFAAALAGSD